MEIRVKDKSEQVKSLSNEIKRKEETIMDGQRQIQELNALLLKQKKKINSDSNGLKDTVKERESEIDVLKEMIRGIKLQVKSKDTDI